MIFDVEFKGAPKELEELAAGIDFDVLNDNADGCVQMSGVPFDEDRQTGFENGAKMAAMAARRDCWTIYKVEYTRVRKLHGIARYTLYFIGNYIQLRNLLESLKEQA